MRILIVDDTRTLREMLRETLLKAGHTVVEAADGRHGLDSFRREQPQLVITDLNMPVMDGVELTRAIRSLPEGRSVPVFVLSTENRPEWKARGREAGATGWMVKPFDAGRLLGTLARYER